MSGFRFNLDRILNWRRKQCQLEEMRLAASRASLADVERGITGLREERLGIGRELSARLSPAPFELNSLGPYYLRAKRQELELTVACTQKQTEVQSQLAVVRVADRGVRLLEKLRQRRLEEFTYAHDRDLETLAAEAFLSKWSRTASETRSRNRSSAGPQPPSPGGRKS